MAACPKALLRIMTFCDLYFGDPLNWINLFESIAEKTKLEGVEESTMKYQKGFEHHVFKWQF